MLTINLYPKIVDGDGLASVANSILANYQKYGGQVLRTNSIPKTKNKPAEHLIVAVLGTPDFLEFVQARIKLIGNQGSSIVYSHRVYGKEAGPMMKEWIQANGARLEEKLMFLESIPTIDKLNKLNSQNM